MLTPEDFYPDLAVWEGCFTWMYLDEKGLVTTGTGNLLPTAASAAALEWWAGPRRATDAEAAAAWTAVKAQKPNLLASYYARFTTCRLTPTYAKDLALRRLQEEFLPGIRKLFPGFDGYPGPAQRVIVDDAYNEGLGSLAGFTRLRRACEAGDWKAATKECVISTSRKKRNDWRQKLMGSLIVT